MPLMSLPASIEAMDEVSRTVSWDEHRTSRCCLSLSLSFSSIIELFLESYATMGVPPLPNSIASCSPAKTLVDRLETCALIPSAIVEVDSVEANMVWVAELTLRR